MVCTHQTYPLVAFTLTDLTGGGKQDRKGRGEKEWEQQRAKEERDTERSQQMKKKKMEERSWKKKQR